MAKYLFARTFAFVSASLVLIGAVALGSHPASANFVGLAAMLPISAVTPHSGIGERLRALVADPNALVTGVRPYEGRHAATRDQEATVVREHLKPLNPVA